MDGQYHLNEMENKVKELRELRNMANDLAAEIAAIEDELKAHMRDNGANELHGPTFKITWKETGSHLGVIIVQWIFKGRKGGDPGGRRAGKKAHIYIKDYQP